MTLQHNIRTKILKMTIAIQTLPPKGIQPQKYVIATEQSSGNQRGNEPVPFLNCFNNCPTDIQESTQHTTTTIFGDATTPPLTITTPIIEEGLMRDE